MPCVFHFTDTVPLLDWLSRTANVNGFGPELPSVALMSLIVTFGPDPPDDGVGDVDGVDVCGALMTGTDGSPDVDWPNPDLMYATTDAAVYRPFQFDLDWARALAMKLAS